jgi:hypothetical protein
MRLRDIITESTETDLPSGTKHTLPRTVILPDMDPYYEFYRFVSDMACHPEFEKSPTRKRSLRNVPLVVAYTPQEYEMVKAVAACMGQRIEEIAFGSQETPGGNTVSPVAKFQMSESQIDIMRALLETIKERSS